MSTPATDKDIAFLRRCLPDNTTGLAVARLLPGLLARLDAAESALASANERAARVEAALDLLDPRKATALYDRIADDFHRSTGLMAPGKSVPAEMTYSERDEATRQAKWRPFVNRWHERLHDSLVSAIAGEEVAAIYYRHLRSMEPSKMPETLDDLREHLRRFPQGAR